VKGGSCGLLAGSTIGSHLVADLGHSPCVSLFEVQHLVPSLMTTENHKQGHIVLLGLHVSCQLLHGAQYVHSSALIHHCSLRVCCVVL
jgi:hypothetical protein